MPNATDAKMMNRDWLNATHSRFRTPHRAVVATGVVTALLIAAGLQVEAIIELLAEVGSFSFLIAYALVHVSVIVIRRADPAEYEPAFEIPGPLYPVVPIVGIILSFAIITQMEPIVIAIGCGIVALGAVWYLVYVRNREVDESLMGEAIVEEPAGGAPAIEGYKVVVPVANPETQQDLLRLAAVNASTHGDEADPEIVAVNVVEVPSQTSLEQNLQFEEERIEIQRELLESAREAAVDLEVDLRTRAIVGRDVGRTILDVIDEEEADHVVLGWHSEPGSRDTVFGSNLDPVVRRAPCEVSIVDLENAEIGSPVSLAGPGPHAPVAARRAAEFATLSESKPTLLNVQQTTDDPDIDPVELGEAMIEDVATEAGLESGSYEADVVLADDVQSGILTEIRGYDTVVAGVSEQSSISKILHGSIAETIEEEAEDNVVMVRSPYDTTRSVREAIAERLAD